MRYFIITGVSSGLGAGIAETVLLRGDSLFGLSRRENRDLSAIPLLDGAIYKFLETDLKSIETLNSTISNVFKSIPKDATQIILINNAGIVEPVKPLGNATWQEIKAHVDTNLTAPIILANAFIRESIPYNSDKVIVNISSGAAYTPYFGWSLYCSSKAALNMVTKAVGLEQSRLGTNIRIISIAPGVVDTPMQSLIRNIDESDFPKKEKFVNLYNNNQLISPRESAVRILDIIERIQFNNGEILDVRE